MSALPKTPRDTDIARPTLRPAPMRRAALVTRLTRPGLDPAKRRIRAQLMLQSDEQLRDGLGWSRVDIDAFRAAGRADEQAVVARARRETMAPSTAMPMPMAA